MTREPILDHPTLALVKNQFPDLKLKATEFRGLATLIVPAPELHAVMEFLRNDSACAYDFLSDVTAVDYLGYAAGSALGRFAVVYVLKSYANDLELVVKTYLDPSCDTSGTEADPALTLDSVTDLWPGAEWTEREVFDMFGIRFRNHPDLRRILCWESYPAHPLRKDYPLHGRGERENYRVVEREHA
ncbi:MAG: NADH-quinone oxidoreductase subunit C [Planctomycetes bacterium]|nr:NADH-quinone oxidoreductase subunit C [Planctomycetota bacterium]NOG54034.1 NADH-quinone oxidoreductase subunit C [Planctomycetota bacterium]